MLIINIAENGGLEKALKVLKRKFTNTKTVTILRDRQAYTKPSVRRRAEIKRGIYRAAFHQES